MSEPATSGIPVARSPRPVAPWVMLGGGLVLLAAVFGLHLGGDFVWDDRAYLLESARVRSPEGWRALLTEPFALGGAVYRPFSTITLWLEWQVFGPSIVALRIGNLAMHLATGFLVFAWLRKLAVRAGVATVLAWMWLVHPLATEPVMFANARHDVLGALCALGALYAWPRATARPSAFVLPSVLALLAMACKESFVVLPALLAMEAVRIREPSTSLRRALAPVGVPVLAVLAFFGLRRVLGISSSSDQLGAGVRANAVHFGTIVLHYARLFFTGQNGPTVERYVPEAPAASLVALGLALALAVILARAASRGRTLAGVALLGLAFFLVALAPNVLAVPALGQYGNRYAYFPMVGLVVLAGAGIEELLLQFEPSMARFVVGAGVVVALFLAASTSLEASAWTSALTLFGRDLDRAPGDSRALYHFGVAVSREAGCPEALPFFLRATEREPTYARAWHNVSGCFINLGQFSEAVEASRRALALAPGSPGALYNLGVSLVSLGRRDEGIEVLERALAADPADAATRGALAAARRLE